MTNAEWMQKNGIKFKRLRVERENGNVYTVVIEGKGRMDGGTWVCADNKIKAILQWLDKEHKEPTLDDTEKEYLAAVIKPFKEDVICIEKNDYDIWDGIRIVVRRGSDFNIIALPMFHKGTMYKGMELNRKYKVEELGL